MLNHLEPSSNKKRRRKNRRTAAIRSSSAFTSTSTSIHSLASINELETAKAAAIKLLDHSSDLSWHILPSCLINQKNIPNPSQANPQTQSQDDHLLASTPTLSTNLGIESPSLIIQAESKSQSSCQALKSPPITATSRQLKQVPKSGSSPGSFSLSGSQSVPHPPQPHQSSSSSRHSAKLKPSFHVTREEVFSNTAIVDAFQAAMNEFNYFKRLEIGHSGGEEPELEQIKLPQSATHQRRVSALYYGQPPTHSTSKTKKPRLDSIFLPHIALPSNPIEKLVKAKEVMKQDAARGSCDSTSRSSGSDLDMEDYWDMMGSQSDDKSVSVDDNDEVNNKNMVIDKENKNESIGQTEANQSVSELTVQKEPGSRSTSSPATHPNPTQEGLLSTSDLQQNKGEMVPEHSNNIDVLTDSQKILLSNSLSAQYWAGYHAAMLNQSLGISFQNLPILIPQNDNHHHHIVNNPVSSSLSSVVPNFSSLSPDTSPSKSPLG